MEDDKGFVDIYYQYNGADDIKKEKFNKIIQNPYFLIESTKNANNLTYDYLESLLLEDGVDKSKIGEYRFRCEEETNGVTHFYIKPLSKNNFQELKEFIKSNKIYLHLIIKKKDKNKEEQILKEMEDYNAKITKAGKNVDSLYKELTHEKKISSNTIPYFKQNFFSKDNIPDERESKTFIKSNKLNKSNINQNEMPNNIINDNSNKIEVEDLSCSSSGEYNKIVFDNMNNHQFKKLYSMQIPDKKEKIKLCYLYANPLVNEDNKSKYIDTDYFDEMVTIYDIFTNSKYSAQLEFEPIIYDFNRYIEKFPDILHIKVKSSKDQQHNMKIELDYFGKLSYYKCTDLKRSLCTETGISQIKLLILATQNIEEIQVYFKDLGIKDIIYIDNKMEKGDYPRPNEAEENFIKELYYYILIEGLSIQDSFKTIKGKYESKITVFQTNPKGQTYILPSQKMIEKAKRNLSAKNLNISVIKKVNNPNIKTNKNCSLNLDFVKYNYKRIIGRNIELKECIKYMQRYNNVCICGHPGVGKKSFAQLAGKFAFERNEYKEVHFITIYNLGNAQSILMNKINIINNLNKKNDENQLEFENKKILLIIYYDNIISKESEIKNFEEIINKIKFNNIYFFLYVFTISKNFNFGKVRLNLYDTPMIELHKLESEKRLDLLSLITYDLEKNNIKFLTKLTKNLIKELIKKTNGYPNDIYLLALFMSCSKDCYNKIINDSNIKINLEEIIFNYFIENDDIFEKNDGNMIKKIISIFTILKLGIRDDILDIFFAEKEIKLIKNRLNLIIFEENDEKGTNYVLDSSFRSLIKSLFIEKEYEKVFICILKSILKKYALILRYLVNSQKCGNQNFEFHAGIINNFWFSVNGKKISSNFKSDYKNFNKSRNPPQKIYFDDVKYFINILDLFSDEYYFAKIESNINELTEYISQISICLPTLLYLNKKNIYVNAIEPVFNTKLGKLKLYRSLLRLKIFKYWLSDDSAFLPKETDLLKINYDTCNEKGEVSKDIYAEFYLIKIYDHARHNQNLDITHIYNECKNYCRDNKFNLEKLEALYAETKKVVK